MPTLHSPRVSETTVEEGAIVVRGDRGERLSVVAVTEHIFRVTHAPEGQPRLERTWCVVGDHVEVPREGRVRDDYSTAFPDAPCGSALDHVGAAVLETSALKATVCTRTGEHFLVRWSDGDGVEFASDRPHGAYLYESQPGGGGVRHYMSAVPGERYFGFGETSGELDKAGRRLRLAAR